MSEPRFQPGDRVRVDERIPTGHCRAPLYLRGKTGEVVKHLGTYGNPEQLAYYEDAEKLPLYYVVFRQKDIWADYDGPAGDTVAADFYENWLEPAGGN